jgi:hypothetical protein
VNFHSTGTALALEPVNSRTVNKETQGDSSTLSATKNQVLRFPTASGGKASSSKWQDDADLEARVGIFGFDGSVVGLDGSARNREPQS